MAQSKTELIKQLESLQTTTAARLAGDEVTSLVHELQVHQIELEVQNLELREAQHSLEEARDRYADLYDFAPVAYVTLDRNGIIQELNLTAVGLLGRERARVLGIPFAIWLTPQDKAGFYAHVKRVFQSATKAVSELRIKNATGDPIWVRLASAFAPSAHGEPGVCRTAIVDITDRKQAEKTLAAHVHQQAILAELGQRALAGVDLQTLLAEAVARVAEGLETEYVNVLELLPDRKHLLLRAGVGWKDGCVERTTVSASEHTQAGYTLRSNAPVIAEDLQSEPRFRGSGLLRDHGVVSGLSVIIEGRDGPYGVLGAHTAHRRSFSENDINFVRLVASLLASSIERRRSFSESDVSFVQLVANLLANSIERRRTEDAPQEAHGLEERAERRTAALSEANLLLQRKIGEHQRANEGHIRLTKEMDAERARLNALLSQMPAGVVIAEAPSGKLIAGNEQVEKILHQPFIACQDLAAWKAYTGFHADGRRYTPEEWPLARSLLNGEVVSGEEIEMLRGDGSRAVIQVGSTPIRDADGRITAGVAVLSDITERKRAEKEALDHRTQLAHVARLSTIGEMASGIAHEINQPLASIVLFAQGCLRMMDSGTADSRELRRVMQQVAEQGLRAGEIIRRVMQFTRKQTGHRTLADLNQLVREMIALVRSEAREHRSVLQLDLAEDLPEILVDTIQIEQVILNLLRNAMEALETVPDGPRVLSVQTTGSGAGVVELAVADTGPGLVRESHDQLFDPFFTTKPSGLGLGLSISRSIVTAHGGRLWADLSRADGARFHVTLPAAKEGRDEP